MERIRVLIVDDHNSFRSGMRSLLDSIPQIEVVGEAASGDEAVSKAKAFQPHVILMDIQMPGLNGIEATRRIYQSSPHISILMLTMFEDDDSVFAAIRAGAHGYLLKGADQEEILRALQAAHKGEALFGPGIARRMINLFSPPVAKKDAMAFPELTVREREVLDLIAEGLNNAGIAERLVISMKTVRNHVSNIFSKMQVTDRGQAIVLARDAGMGYKK